MTYLSKAILFPVTLNYMQTDQVGYGLSECVCILLPRYVKNRFQCVKAGRE